jgi:hypothetical protein
VTIYLTPGNKTSIRALAGARRSKLQRALDKVKNGRFEDIGKNGRPPILSGHAQQALHDLIGTCEEAHQPILMGSAELVAHVSSLSAIVNPASPSSVVSKKTANNSVFRVGASGRRTKITEADHLSHVSDPRIMESHIEVRNNLCFSIQLRLFGISCFLFYFSLVC